MKQVSQNKDDRKGGGVTKKNPVAFMYSHDIRVRVCSFCTTRTMQWLVGC